MPKNVGRGSVMSARISIPEITRRLDGAAGLPAQRNHLLIVEGRDCRRGAAISGAMNTVRRFLKKQIPLFVVTCGNMEDLAGGNALAIELGGRPLYKGRISQRAKIDPIMELLETRVAA